MNFFKKYILFPNNPQITFGAKTFFGKFPKWIFVTPQICKFWSWETFGGIWNNFLSKIIIFYPPNMQILPILVMRNTHFWGNLQQQFFGQFWHFWPPTFANFANFGHGNFGICDSQKWAFLTPPIYVRWKGIYTLRKWYTICMYHYTLWYSYTLIFISPYYVRYVSVHDYVLHCPVSGVIS